MKVSDSNWNLYLLLIIFICSAPAIYGFYYIESYAVDVPYWDQWNTIVLWTIEYYEGNFYLSSLIAPMNDSRPVLPSAFILITSLLTDLDIKFMFYLGYIFYIVSILIIIFFIKKDTDFDHATLFLLIPIFYYAFNPYFMIRFIHNIGSIQYPILIFTALIAIYLLHLSRDSYYYFFGSILVGVMCTFSFAAGLSIWFAGLFQLTIQNMNNKKIKIIFWLVSIVITFYTYFIHLGIATTGPHSTSAYASFFEALWQHPIHKFLCFMGTFGAQVIHQKEIALYFGIIISISVVALLCINRNYLELDRLSKWYGLLAFGTLISLQLALTRSGSDLAFGGSDTIFFIPEARHSLAIFLPLICIYVLSILFTKDTFTKTTSNESWHSYIFLGDRRQQNLFLLGIIFLLISLGAILHVMPGMAGGKSMHNQQVANQYYLENYKIQPDENLELLSPFGSTIREQASMLERHHLGVFAKDPINIYNYSKLNVDTYSYIDLLNQKVVHSPVIPIVINQEKEDAIEIVGWAVDKHANGPARAVFIVIDDELHVPTIYGLERPDVAKAYNNKKFRHSGFRASFASSIFEEGPHNFTIKIISKAGDGYYTSNQIVSFVCI